MSRSDFNRTPAYLSCASLARELDVSESTISDWTKRGILPQPYKPSGGCVRWCWEEVKDHLARYRPGLETDADPYLAGVAKNATQAKESGRDAS